MNPTQPALRPAPVVTPADAETLHVMGSTLVFAAKGDELGIGCTQFVVTGEPGVGVPMHVHTREDELFIVLEGTVRFELDGQPPIFATAGTSVFGPRDVAHTWSIVGDKPARAIVTVLPGGLEKMFRELGALPPGAPDLAKVGEICARYGIHFV